MGNIGWPELVVILLIVLLLVGASRLPAVARALGEAIQEFKRGVSGKDPKPPQKE